MSRLFNLITVDSPPILKGDYTNRLSGVHERYGGPTSILRGGYTMIRLLLVTTNGGPTPIVRGDYTYSVVLKYRGGFTSILSGSDTSPAPATGNMLVDPFPFRGMTTLQGS